MPALHPAIHPVNIFCFVAFVAMSTFLFSFLVAIVRKDTALVHGRAIPVPFWELCLVLIVLTLGILYLPQRMTWAYVLSAGEVGVGALVMWRHGIPFKPVSELPWCWGKTFLIAMWMAMGLTLISGYLYIINEMLCKAMNISGEGQDLRSFLLTSKDPVRLTLVFGVMLVAAPGAEEFIMRGIVQSSLRQYFSPIPAILVTSVIFAALHFTPVAFLSLMFNSIVFGLAYERKGSIPFNLFLHSSFNLVFVIITLLERFFGKPGALLPC